jgi:hypothetical protein
MHFEAEEEEKKQVQSEMKQLQEEKKRYTQKAGKLTSCYREKENRKWVC